MEQDKIGFFQLSILFMMSVGLMNHVMVIPMLLTNAKRDAWIAVLVTAVFFLVWLLLLRYVMKRTQHIHLFSWLYTHYGKVAAWGLSLCVYLFLLLLIGVTLKDTILWTVTSYFPQSPGFILAFVFILICYFAATSNLTTLSILGGFLLFFVIVLGFFVMSVNFLHKDYSKLLPLLEHGWRPVFQGMIYSAGGLVELTLLLFLQHQVKKNIKTWKMLFLGIILVGLTMGPLMGALALFGPYEAADQRYPAYEQWRLLKIGKYMEHLDFFSVYQWLSGAFIRISLGLYIIGQLFPLTIERNRHKLIGASALLVFLGMFLPISDMELVRFMQHLYFPLSLLLFLTISLLISILSLGKGG